MHGATHSHAELITPWYPPIPGTYLNLPRCLKGLLTPDLFRSGSKHTLLVARGRDRSSSSLVEKTHFVPVPCRRSQASGPGSGPCLCRHPSALPLLLWRLAPEPRGPPSTCPRPHQPSSRSPWRLAPLCHQHMGQRPRRSVDTAGTAVTFRFRVSFLARSRETRKIFSFPECSRRVSVGRSPFLAKSVT